jgi:hypothetical protein
MTDPGPETLKAVVFLPATEFTVERVFPIRNLVGDTIALGQDELLEDEGTVRAGDLTAKNADQTASRGGVEDSKLQEAPPKSSQLPPPWPSVPPEDTIRKLSICEPGLDDGEGHGRRITERTRLIPTTSGAPDVLLGIISDRTTPTFQRCEDEPIHTPGAVQQYGVLLALRFNGHEDQDLEVRIASENSQMLLGYGPEQLFRLKSFMNILESETQEDLLGRIYSAVPQKRSNDSSETTEDTQLDVFPATIILPSGSQRQLWCALHIANGTQDLIILEFEPYTEIFCLPELEYQKTLPEKPVSTVDLEVEPEEQMKSTTSKSAPLRVMEIARRKKQNGVYSMDIFSAMTQAQQQLAGAKNVQQVLDIVVGIVAELTGFHRVMLYRFDSEKNGCVEAELVDPQASIDLFRGKLHLITIPLFADLSNRYAFSGIRHPKTSPGTLHNQPHSHPMRS